MNTVEPANEIPAGRGLKRLRIVAFLEGVSYLLLLGVAMPMKYIWGDPGMVRVIGMIHGLLFVLYIMYVVQAKIEHRWTARKTWLAVIASLIPFGTFWADVRLFRGVEGQG